jgi:NAD(P)-dependent dehydrogenase (short-subunit alcohol dehydrogenase family)
MPNTYDLAGKFAIVTGAAKGLGRAIAECLLDNGAEVVAWDAAVVDWPGVRSAVVDITQPAQIAAALSAVPAGKPIDILVNSAGYLGARLHLSSITTPIGEKSSRSIS